MSTPSAPLIKPQPRSLNQTLRFAWNPPSSNGGSPITTYRLRLNGGTAHDQTYAANVNLATVTGLTNGISYTATLEASNDSGSTYGPAATFRTFQPGNGVPNQPATATATSGEDTTNAVVQWTAPSTLPDSTIFWYVIVSQSNNPSDPIIKRTANGLIQSSLIISGLNPASNYTFKVYAVNCPGYSQPRTTNSIGAITSPLDIANCTIWLDGLDPNNNGIQPSNGTNISTWVDKSGSGYSASGGPFPYNTDGLTITGSMDFASGGIPFPSAHTVFLVAYPTVVSAQYYNYATNNTGSSPAFIANYDGSKLEYYNGGDRATLNTAPAGIFVAAYTYNNGGSVVGYYNSSSPVFTISQTTSNSYQYTSIGSPAINARICEYIMYTRVLTSIEIGKVITYLMNTYSI